MLSFLRHGKISQISGASASQCWVCTLSATWLTAPSVSRDSVPQLPFCFFHCCCGSQGKIMVTVIIQKLSNLTNIASKAQSLDFKLVVYRGCPVGNCWASTTTQVEKGAVAMRTMLSSHNCLMTDTLSRKLLALCLSFNRTWGDEGYEEEYISLNHLSFQCSV